MVSLTCVLIFLKLMCLHKAEGHNAQAALSHVHASAECNPCIAHECSFKRGLKISRKFEGFAERGVEVFITCTWVSRSVVRGLGRQPYI